MILKKCILFIFCFNKDCGIIGMKINVIRVKIGIIELKIIVIRVKIICE